MPNAAIKCVCTSRSSYCIEMVLILNLPRQSTTRLLLGGIARRDFAALNTLFIWVYRFPSVQGFTRPQTQRIQLGANIYTFSAEVAAVFFFNLLVNLTGDKMWSYNKGFFWKRKKKTCAVCQWLHTFKPRCDRTAAKSSSVIALAALGLDIAPFSESRGSKRDSLTKCRKTKGSADPVGSSSAQARTRLSRCGGSQRKHGA